MELDDEPEKFRRNLLAVSGFTILFFYMDLSLPENFFGLKINAKNADKFWQVIGFVSLYFFFRYYHSDSAEKYRRDFKSQFHASLYATRALWLARLLGLFKRDIFKFQVFSKAVSKARQITSTHVGFPERELTLDAVSQADGDLLTRVRNAEYLGFTFALQVGGSTSYANEVVVECKLPFIYRVSMILFVTFQVLANSKNIVNSFFPYLIFSVSMTILGIQYYYASSVFYISLLFGSVAI